MKTFAGPDQLIEFPVKEVFLSGRMRDSFYSASLTKLTWRKISGPDGVIIQGPHAAATTLTNLSPGQYEFEFSAAHPGVKIRPDTLSIVAGSLPANPEEVLLAKQQWETPCVDAFIKISNLYKRNPALVPGRFFKVYIRREGESEWTPVVPYSEETGKYSLQFIKAPGVVYVDYRGRNIEDSPDVKVAF